MEKNRQEAFGKEIFFLLAAFHVMFLLIIWIASNSIHSDSPNSASTDNQQQYVLVSDMDHSFVTRPDPTRVGL